MKEIIRIDNGIAKMPEWRMAEPVNFTLEEGENIAIVGPNGGGKTRLVNIIIGAHPLLNNSVSYNFEPSKKTYVSDNIKSITFRDSYGAESDGKYFLQQRWNSTEIDNETPVTGKVLEKAFISSGEDTPERRQWQQHIYDLFSMRHFLDKYIILLSSGELRKYQLAKVLFSEPRILILDNPFIGLDEETRNLLKTTLSDLVKERSLQIILVLAKEDDIPEFITHVVEVRNLKVNPKVSRTGYLSTRSSFPAHVLTKEKEEMILNRRQHTVIGEEAYGNGRAPSRFVTDMDNDTDEVLRFNNVTVRYGERTILKDLNWTVRRGEHWAMSGQNGSGKSTLLSLVSADNPQGYACDISLFGHNRGTGETIWDIKKHIGYVSPEMHRAYISDLPSVRIVASGLSDSVGLYFKPNAEQYEICKWWMNIFGIAHLADVSFLKLASGEQRLVLLARAFVKDPDLLILDEPLHGLDMYNRRLVKDIIDTFCKREGKTLIMVTHYKDEFPDCIDHTIVLKRNL